LKTPTCIQRGKVGLLRHPDSSLGELAGTHLPWPVLQPSQAALRQSDWPLRRRHLDCVRRRSLCRLRSARRGYRYFETSRSGVPSLPCQPPLEVLPARQRRRSQRRGYCDRIGEAITYCIAQLPNLRLVGKRGTSNYSLHRRPRWFPRFAVVQWARNR
jgi:hypothetical protein